jgi:hypothetical protein
VVGVGRDDLGRQTREADGELYVPALGWVVDEPRRPWGRHDGTWPVGGSGPEVQRAATCRVGTRRRPGPL